LRSLKMHPVAVLRAVLAALKASSFSPLNVTANSKPTSIDDVLDQLGREPIDVTYYNIAGQTSTTPWEGLNIVVKRYSDGTTTSTKVIK